MRVALCPSHSHRKQPKIFHPLAWASRGFISCHLHPTTTCPGLSYICCRLQEFSCFRLEFDFVLYSFSALRRGDIFDAHTRASLLNAVINIFKGSLGSEEICSPTLKVSVLLMQTVNGRYGTVATDGGLR